MEKVEDNIIIEYGKEDLKKILLQMIEEYCVDRILKIDSDSTITKTIER